MLFDCDGVLVDSEPITNGVLVASPLPSRDPGAHPKIIGCIHPPHKI